MATPGTPSPTYTPYTSKDVASDSEAIIKLTREGKEKDAEKAVYVAFAKATRRKDKDLVPHDDLIARLRKYRPAREIAETIKNEAKSIGSYTDPSNQELARDLFELIEGEQLKDALEERVNRVLNR